MAQGHEQHISSSVNELGDMVASMPLLYPFSEAQYGNRDKWNRDHSGVPYIPAKLSADQPLNWSPCWSLDSGRMGLLPSEMIYLIDEKAGVPSSFVCDSVGCAAAPEANRAMLHAMLELIERDAVAIWWYNRLERPLVRVDTRDRRFVRWHSYLKAQKREYCLFDITTDIGISTYAAVSWNSNGRRPSMGFGCHPDTGIAAERALREVCQTSIGAAVDVAARYPLSSPERVFLRWSRRTCVFEHPHLKPSTVVRDLDHVHDRTSLHAQDLLGATVATLRRSGLQAWVIPMTRPELGIPVIRIACGELRHPGHRLAPGRLYDVPVRLGWLERALREDEMNPDPCIF